MKKKLKKVATGIGIVLLLVLAWQYKLVMYGIRQGLGQWRIIRDARPVAEVLDDPSFPDSLKPKLRLIAEIKAFAEDSLGLNPSENYTTVFDQKGKPLLWNVTACEPYALKAYKWTFPFLGSVSYKGFFDYEKAQQEEARIKALGYDTEIDKVSGWSTLGYLKDPVLSNMLLRKEGSLANVIIHELTHGTLYVPDSVNYNENLASFVGDEGALRFLRQKYGTDSKQYTYYRNSKADDETFSQFVLKAASSLDSLYKTFGEEMPEAEKKQRKEAYIKLIINSLDTVHFRTEKYCDYFKDYKPNNTFFMDFIRYREKQDMFREQFKREFDSNFPRYIAYLKEKYPSL